MAVSDDVLLGLSDPAEGAGPAGEVGELEVWSAVVDPPVAGLAAAVRPVVEPADGLGVALLLADGFARSDWVAGPLLTRPLPQPALSAVRRPTPTRGATLVTNLIIMNPTVEPVGPGPAPCRSRRRLS